MGVVQAGRALGSRYQLVERLGGGAMGEVWRTADRTTGDEVAAKLLRGEYARDPQIVARFVQERAILLALHHPNIVAVRDLVVEGDDLAIVMELVRGDDLRTYLRARGTLPPREAVEITVAVLRALAHAHAHNVLHRDVKPDNVLLAGTHPLLTDFGIARLAQETTVRATGALGTPEYMAPEVFAAERVSAAADVYAAGVQLYELLAGRTPFAGGSNGYAVAHRHVTAVPPPLPGLPPRLAAALARMLAKEPSRRLSAEGAAQALAGLLPDLDGLPALAPQPQPEVWDTVDGGAVADLGAGGALDPGATNLKGVARDEAVPGPVAAAGDVVALSPGTPEVDTAATSLGVVRPAHQAPTLAPAVVAREPGSKRRQRLLVAAASVAAVAVAGVLVAFVAGRDSGPERPRDERLATAAAKATQAGRELPTGLRVSREAVYDPEAKRLTTTVTWEAGKTPLTGPFFESVPDASCRAAWQPGDAGVTPDRTDGVSAACGFKVDVGTVRAEQQVSAAYTVPFDPKDTDPAAAAEAFLEEAATQTARALDGLAQSTAYAVQRLEGVYVDVPATAHTDDLLQVRLLPEWAGVDEPDQVNVLFDTTATGRPTLLLRQVAGGLANVELSPRGCTDAIGVEKDRYPYAAEQASGCAIRVRVGSIESESDSFDIVYR